MRRPVFINLAVDWLSAGCAHAQTDLGMPIDELIFCVPFEHLSVRTRRTSASDSLVRGCNQRQAFFQDYSHVFVL